VAVPGSSACNLPAYRLAIPHLGGGHGG